MDLGLDGKFAAVAASTGGLGLATAQALVREGVTVAICGRNRVRLDEATAQLGSAAVPICVDVSTADGSASFVESAVAEMGRVDILVTNAGGPPSGTFESTDVDAYRPALELNLMSVVAMCKAAVPAMQQRKWGRVIAITSSTVRQPSPTLILSNTARAGATGFLKTLALEVAGDGVTVNSLQPGLHDTDRLRSLYGDTPPAAPTGGVGEPADFGAFAAFLASEHARFITGTAIPVDGGAYKALL